MDSVVLIVVVWWVVLVDEVKLKTFCVGEALMGFIFGKLDFNKSPEEACLCQQLNSLNFLSELNIKLNHWSTWLFRLELKLVD